MSSSIHEPPAPTPPSEPAADLPRGFAVVPLLVICGARVVLAIATGETWGAEATLCLILLGLGLWEFAFPWRPRVSVQRHRFVPVSRLVDGESQPLH